MKCGMEQSGKHLHDAKRLKMRRLQRGCNGLLAEGVGHSAIVARCVVFAVFIEVLRLLMYL